MDKLQAFIPELLGRLHIESLLQGNVTEEVRIVSDKEFVSHFECFSLFPILYLTFNYYFSLPQ